VAKFLVEILVNAAGVPEANASFASVGTSAQSANSKVEASALKAETALRRTQEAAKKLSDQMADTGKSKALVSDLTALNSTLDKELEALKGGPAAWAKYQQSLRDAASAQQILTAQVRAGVSAESDAGKQIAALITQRQKLTQELQHEKSAMSEVGGNTSILSAILGKLGGVTGEGGLIITEMTERLTHMGETLAKSAEEGGGFINVIGGMAASVGEFLPLILAVAAAAATVGVAWKAFEFLKDVVAEGLQTQVVIGQLNRSILANGAAAGFSAHELVDYAESLALLTGKSKESIIAGLAIETRFTHIGHNVFPQVAEAALAMVKALPGESIEQAFSTLSRVMDGDVRALMQLKEAGVVLQPEQKKFLQSLIDGGKLGEYQAEVIGILTEKWGKLGDLTGGSLLINVNRAKVVYAAFKEEIASEVIPALENLANELIKQAGGWENFLSLIKEKGEEVGRVIRTVIDGLIISYNEHTMEQTYAAMESVENAKKMKNTWYDLAEAAVKVWARIPVFLGGGWVPGVKNDAGSQAVAGMEKWRAEMNAEADKTIADLKSRMERAGALILSAQNDLVYGPKALSGSDAKPPAKPGGADDIAKKSKSAADAQAEWDKTVRKLNEDLANQLRVLGDEEDSINILTVALGRGMVAYNQEQQVQQRSAAVTKALAEAAKVHAAEVDKLIDVIKKLHDAGKTNDEAEKKKELDALEASYEATTYAIANQAAATFDAKSINKDALAVTQQSIAYDHSAAVAKAALADAINHNHVASLQVERDWVIRQAEAAASSLTTDKAKIQSAKDQAAASFDLTNNLKQQTAVQLQINAAELATQSIRASVTDWQSERQAALEYGPVVAGILKQYGLLSAATQQRVIDEKVLAAIERGDAPEEVARLRDTLEAQQKIVNGLHQMQAEIVIAEKNYKDLADSLASNLSNVIGNILKGGEVKVSDFLGAFRDAFASTTQKVLQDWLTQQFEAMAAWLSRWLATQAAAKAGSAVLGGGGGANAEGADYTGAVTSTASSAAWSAWAGSGSTSAAGGSSGGMGALFSGTGSYGAVGMVGAWVVALAAFGYAVNKLNDHMKSTEQDAIDLNKTLDVSMSAAGGGAHISNLIGQGKQLAYQIKQFFTAYDGIFASLDESIGIKRRGRGNNTEWKVYADGVVTSFGKDMNAALGYALIQAVKHSSSQGLDPLVIAAIKDYAGKSIDEFKAQVDFAQRIATQNLPGISGQLSAASQQYFSDLHQAQAQFADDLTALNDATISIAQKFSDTVQGIKNSALGIDTSTADFLAGLVGLQDRMSKATDQIASQLQADLDKANMALSAMGAGPKTKPGLTSDESDKVKEDWNTQRAALEAEVAKYTDLLKKIPEALSDSQVNMAVFDSLYKYLQGSGKYAAQAAAYAKMKVDIEFEAIRLQLVVLNKWEEFAGMWQDALTAAEGAAVIQARQKPGGGGTSRSDQQASLRSEIGGMRAAQLGDLASQKFSLDQSIADFTKRAKEAKLPADELAAGIALLKKKFEETKQAAADSYAGIGTDFTARLKAMQQFWVEFDKEIQRKGRGSQKDPREGESFKRFGDELQASINAFMGLVDPMLAINTQADAMRQNVLAYGKAMGWTDEQIKKMLDEVQAGIDYQRQNAVNGIIGNLYNYLKDDEAYQKDKQAFDLQMMELNFQLMEAQLKALGAWNDSTEALWTAAHDAAKKTIEAGNVIAAAARIYQPTSGATTEDLLNAMKSAAQAWQQGIQAFTQSTQSLLINPALTGLTPEQQLAAAQANYNSLLARAQGGDVGALNQLDQARQALLALGHTMYQGGQGFADIWNQVMTGSANLLANAQAGEQGAMQMAANAIVAGADANAATIASAIYAGANQVANQIYASFNGLPHYAEGGIALRPHMAMVGDRGPEAIIPILKMPMMPVSTRLSHPMMDGARVLQYRSQGGIGAGAGAGAGAGGMGGSASSSPAHDQAIRSLAHSIDRLTAAQGRADKHLSTIATKSSQMAKSNDALVRTDRIRTMVDRRTRK